MMETTKVDLLQQTPFATVLNTQELSLLSHHVTQVRFNQGDHIIQQGQESNGLFILIEGKALLTAKVLGAGSTNLETLTPGSLIGERTIIEKGPHSASVIAVEESLCLYIAKSYFDMLAYLFPATKTKINEIFAQKMCENLKFQHANVLNLMQKISIKPETMLGQVIKTFHKPTAISFTETKFKLNDLLEKDFFKDFQLDELDKLFGYCDIIQAPKQCTLIQTGETKSPCYIVLRGAVQVSVVQNNKFAKLFVVSPMMLFCCMTYVLSDSQALFNYTTCEKAILLRFPYEKMQAIKTDEPDLWFKLYDLIAQSIATLIQFADKLEVRLNSESYNRGHDV